MSVSFDYKLLFIHIPKNAGTSVREAMQSMDKRFISLDHLTIKELKQLLHPNFFDALFKFAIVRNPWDRAVSLYYFSKTESFKLSNPDIFARHFELNFVQFLERSNFALQQIPWISIDDQIEVNYVGRFEQLQETTEAIARISQSPKFQLPHRNRTEHPPYQEYYTDYARKLVSRKCEKDIDTFRYTFGSKSRQILL